jgi:heme-degrading monooxygenase HmoA
MTIHDSNLLVTQITTVKLPPDKQDKVLNLMVERARFMATQPGFVSIALRRSKDGSHVVNYVQWRDVDSSRRRITRLNFARNGRSSERSQKRSILAFTTWCTSKRLSCFSFTALMQPARDSD